MNYEHDFVFRMQSSNAIFDTTKQKRVHIDVLLMDFISITKHHQPSILRTNIELRVLDVVTIASHLTSFNDLELVVTTFH